VKKKPWVVGVLSIVPGLGLAALGEIRRGLVALILTLLPFACLLGPWEAVAVIGATLGLVAWITQGAYAVVAARRLALEEAGLALPVREVSIAPLGPAASAEEKRLHRVRRIVLSLLNPGENLRAAVQGALGLQPTASTLLNLGAALAGGHSAGVEPARPLYLGVTDEELILVWMDAFGRPNQVQRIRRDRVSLVKHTEGAVADEIVIETDETGPLRVGVGRTLRSGTRELTRALSM
jgi:hypothetical protein